MKFIAAIAHHNDFHVLNQVLAWRPEYVKYLRAVLVSPLVTKPGIMRMAREAQERGIPLMFDSGGYQVQSGILTYTELLERLGDAYRDHPYADLYVLPDHVPHSDDDEETIERKVCDTIRESVGFYKGMPTELRPRALAVIQGRKREQMERCLAAYREAGIKHIGFGGFATGGKGGQPKLFTYEIICEVQRLADEVAQSGQTLHVFGIGSVRVLPFLGYAGVTSCDATSWAKSAGFGWVYLPMTGRYGIGCSRESDRYRTYAKMRFLNHKTMIGHECPWCEDLDTLETDKLARSRHNLAATFDVMRIIEEGNWLEVKRIFSFLDRPQARLWRQFTDEIPQQLDLFSA